MIALPVPSICGSKMALERGGLEKQAARTNEILTTDWPKPLTRRQGSCYHASALLFTPIGAPANDSTTWHDDAV